MEEFEGVRVDEVKRAEVWEVLINGIFRRFIGNLDKMIVFDKAKIV